MAYKDPEKARAYKRKWQAAYAKAHPEVEKNRVYTEEQRARKRANAKRWREENIDRAKANGAKHRETRKANPDMWRKGYLKRRFGVTLEQYKEMEAAQGGRCAICGREEPERTHLAVDHCHKTGKVRGLLCRLCNTALGAFGDSPDMLRAAIQYIEKSR